MGVDKIISGGQTGVDRAALDAAAEAGIETGGYCPKGRRAEDGIIPARYHLVETTSAVYAERTRKNVAAADGTLILNIGPIEGGTAMTARSALKLGKPCRIVQLDQSRVNCRETHVWLAEHAIGTLNVAGPRESKTPGGIYQKAYRFMKRLLREQGVCS